MKLGPAHGANRPVIVSDKVSRSYLEQLVDKPLSRESKAGLGFRRLHGVGLLLGRPPGLASRFEYFNSMQASG
jgi:hypothetical protein